MTFIKGQSGNPAGRRPRTPDRRTSVRALLRPHMHRLAEQQLELALAGDSVAAAACAALWQCEVPHA